MAKLTAETLSDADIKALKYSTMESVLAGFGSIKRREQRVLDLCDLSLGLANRFASLGLMQRDEARREVAALLNARAAGKEGQ